MLTLSDIKEAIRKEDAEWKKYQDAKDEVESLRKKLKDAEGKVPNLSIGMIRRSSEMFSKLVDEVREEVKETTNAND